MKTKKLILGIVALVFVTNIYATKTPRMNIIPLENSKALVAVSQDVPATNDLTITSSDGEIVYYKQSKNQSEEFRQVFDLSGLDDGNYCVKVKSDNIAVKRKIKIEDGKVAVDLQTTEYDPYFKFADNILKLTYLNFENNDVKLKVFNNGEIIYTSQLGNDFTVNAGFDLSQLEKGNYDILLTNSDEEYWFSVNK